MEAVSQLAHALKQLLVALAKKVAKVKYCAAITVLVTFLQQRINAGFVSDTCKSTPRRERVQDLRKKESVEYALEMRFTETPGFEESQEIHDRGASAYDSGNVPIELKIRADTYP